MVAQTFQLVMRTGPHPGKVFELKQNEMMIGRDVANHVVINDPEISRKHARLNAQPGGGYILEDLGSTNGTFINGQRLMGPHLLRHGEEIMFGENVSVRYEMIQFDPDATLIHGAAQPPKPSSRDTYVIPPQDIPSPPAPIAPQPVPVTPPPEPLSPQPVYDAVYPGLGQVAKTIPEPAIPQPFYSDAYSAAPAEQYSPAQPEPYETPEVVYQDQAPGEQKKPKIAFIWIILGVVGLVLCCLVVGGIVFDTANLYCQPPFEAFFNCP